MIKKILKFICLLVIIYAVFGICMLGYSVLWMRPHAEKALREFKSSVSVGMKLESIREVAMKVGADRYSVIDLPTPRNGATKMAVISFHRFPTGLSANVCFVYLKDNIAIDVNYSYRG